MPITRCNSVGFKLLFGLAILIATVAMLSPKGAPDFEITHLDKLGHLATFALLAFLLDSGWPESRFHAKKWGGLLAYGLAIEGLQHFIPNRSFDLLDAVADATGLILYGLLILPLLYRVQFR